MIQVTRQDFPYTPLVTRLKWARWCTCLDIRIQLDGLAPPNRVNTGQPSRQSFTRLGSLFYYILHTCSTPVRPLNTALIYGVRDGHGYLHHLTHDTIISKSGYTYPPHSTKSERITGNAVSIYRLNDQIPMFGTSKSALLICKFRIVSPSGKRLYVTQKCVLRNDLGVRAMFNKGKRKETEFVWYSRRFKIEIDGDHSPRAGPIIVYHRGRKKSDVVMTWFR